MIPLNRQQRRQRRRHVVVAGLGLAFDPHPVTVEGDGTGEGERRHPQQLGELLRHHPAGAVGGFGAGDHQIGLFPLQGGRQHGGGEERVGAAQRGVVDDDGPVGAHGQRLADPLQVAGGGHRHQGHGGVPGVFGEAEADLHPVAVGVVEHLILGPDDEVTVRIQLVRGRRVRDLLDTDGDLHEWSLLGTRIGRMVRNRGERMVRRAPRQERGGGRRPER
jgi:hypothetical protein